MEIQIVTLFVLVNCNLIIFYAFGAVSNKTEYYFYVASPSESLKFPLQTNFTQINSGGPPDPYPRSKNALSLAIISDDEPQSSRIIDEIKEGLQYVFQTENDFTLAIHGSGTLAAFTVLDNLIEEGDKVLVLSIGKWGERLATMAQRLGATVIHQKRSPGTKYSLSEVDSALKMHRPDILAMVQGESSASVKQPMEGIGDLCIKYGALLALDVVAIVGIQPALIDERKIDAAFASSNKGIGAVSGMAPISLSERAILKLKSRQKPPISFATDLLRNFLMWNASDPQRERPHSLSMPLLYSLREGLASVVEEGLENSFKRHEATSAQLHEGLRQLGLRFGVANQNDRMTSITAVYTPRGKDPYKITSYMFNKFKIEISTFSAIPGRIIRISTFGMNANPERVNKLLCALQEALQSPETSL